MRGMAGFPGAGRLAKIAKIANSDGEGWLAAFRRPRQRPFGIRMTGLPRGGSWTGSPVWITQLAEVTERRSGHSWPMDLGPPLMKRSWPMTRLINVHSRRGLSIRTRSVRLTGERAETRGGQGDPDGNVASAHRRRHHPGRALRWGVRRAGSPLSEQMSRRSSERVMTRRCDTRTKSPNRRRAPAPRSTTMIALEHCIAATLPPRRHPRRGSPPLPRRLSRRGHP